MMRLAVVAVVVGMSTVGLADVTLTDGNATAVFDLDSSAGLKDWTVDGVDHIARQWFWYRIGSAGGESSIDAICTPTYITSNTNFDPDDDTLTVQYLDTSGNFRIELKFSLTGGTPGSGTSDLGESISIVNTSATETLEFHFFQYCNFDLGGTATDASVEITGGNTALQKDLGCYISESVETPKASHFEAAYYSSIVDSLNDGLPTTLNDIAGPVTNGDLTWAFQWDFPLAPGDTFIISKDKLIVPEPAMMSLLVLGGIGVLLRRRRK